MTREDIIRFYQATPIWLWPLLWLRLHWLRAYMDRRMMSGTGGLARIFTHGRGGLHIEWIVREENLSHNALSFSERYRDWQFEDLDRMSRLFEASSGWTVRMDASRADLTLRAAEAPLEPGWRFPCLPGFRTGDTKLRAIAGPVPIGAGRTVGTALSAFHRRRLAEGKRQPGNKQENPLGATHRGAGGEAGIKISKLHARCIGSSAAKPHAG